MTNYLSMFLVTLGIAGALTSGLGLCALGMSPIGPDKAFDEFAQLLTVWLPVSALILLAGLIVRPHLYRHQMHIVGATVGLIAGAILVLILLGAAPGLMDDLPSPDLARGLAFAVVGATLLEARRVLSRSASA